MMKNIINDSIEKLKSRVDDIVKKFKDNGLNPESLTRFEQDLNESFGEVARTVEKAVLEDADIVKPYIELDGMRHYWKYRGPQEYQCFFGKIEVWRSVYQANGERTICPLELNAGILHHHLTPLAAEFVAYNTAFMVPGELEAHCQRWQHMRPSATTIKLAAGEVGEMAEGLREFYEEEIHQQEIPLPEKTEVVTVSRDGTSVNVREDGWRQAQAGAISFYGKEEEGKDRRERLRTVYLGQMPEEQTTTFEEKFDREVRFSIENLPRNVKIACIGDGALSNWKYFETHPLLKKGVHINDFWHSTEHLSAAAEALFGRGTEEAMSWYKKYRDILKTKKNGAQRLIRSIRYYRKHLNLKSGERLKVIRDALRYFTRNQKRMKYAEYRAQGLLIGSGVVEAACKTVIGHRLKRSGMRWSIEGGQFILNLRTLVLSKRWDYFWKCHEAFLGEVRIAA